MGDLLGGAERTQDAAGCQGIRQLLPPWRTSAVMGASPNSSGDPHHPCKAPNPPRVVDQRSYRIGGRGGGGEARRSKPARFGAISVIPSSDLEASHGEGSCATGRGLPPPAEATGGRVTPGWDGRGQRELELRMRFPRTCRAPPWSCSTQPPAALAAPDLR